MIFCRILHQVMKGWNEFIFPLCGSLWQVYIKKFAYRKYLTLSQFVCYSVFGNASLLAVVPQMFAFIVRFTAANFAQWRCHKGRWHQVTQFSSFSSRVTWLVLQLTVVVHWLFICVSYDFLVFKWRIKKVLRACHWNFVLSPVKF